MKLLTPIDVTDSVLSASNIAEDDYAEWSSGTTYAAGDFVISTATHTVYRSLTAGNVGNDPDLEQVALADPLIADPDPIEWQVISATDRFKPFDKKPSQKVSQADSITFTLTPLQYIGGVAGFGLGANSVTVEMVDASTTVYSQTIELVDTSVVVDWFTYFFEPISELTEFTLTDLPQYASADINVTIDRTGGTATVGQFVIGPIAEIGTTTIGSTGFSGLDFSFVETNDFGDLITVQREATRLADFEVLLQNSTLLGFDARMRGLRGGVPAVWIGDEDSANAAINYGFYRDYRAVYQTTDYAIVNIQVQGIV